MEAPEVFHFWDLQKSSPETGKLNEPLSEHIINGLFLVGVPF